MSLFRFRGSERRLVLQMTLSSDPAEPKSVSIITLLLLSPILGWSGILLALAIIWYHIHKGRIRLPFIRDLGIANSLLIVFFASYFLTCSFSDILHNPKSGVWNQFKSLLPILAIIIYTLSPDKIWISPESLAKSARIAIATIFILTGIEYTYFNLWLVNPEYRSQLLAGNPLHISLWVPMITIMCFADCKDAGIKDRSWTIATSILSIICLSYFLQARASLLVLMPMLLIALYFTLRFIDIRQLGLSKLSRNLLGPLATSGFIFICISVFLFSPERVKQVVLDPLNYFSNPRSDSSLAIRFAHWEAGIEAIKLRPWIGYGASKEDEIMREFVTEPVQIHRHAHQQFISFGIAGGITAILAGILFMILPFLYTLLNSVNRLIILLAAALSATTVIISLIDSLLSNRRHAAIFLLMFAIIISISGKDQDEKSLISPLDHKP